MPFNKTGEIMINRIKSNLGLIVSLILFTSSSLFLINATKVESSTTCYSCGTVTSCLDGEQLPLEYGYDDCTLVQENPPYCIMGNWIECI
jgi:hypothetical protein